MAFPIAISNNKGDLEFTWGVMLIVKKISFRNHSPPLIAYPIVK
jgi:hypothetical protein